MGSKKELAPQEDQGIILGQTTSSSNASLHTTKLYTDQLKTFIENVQKHRLYLKSLELQAPITHPL